MSDDILAACSQAREALRDDPAKSFSALRSILDYPGALSDEEADWQAVFQVVAEISEALGSNAVEASAIVVASNPFSVDNLYKFAYDAYEVGLHGAAATALAKAISLEPESTYLYTELAANLEDEMDNAAALTVLRSAPGNVREDPLVRYLTGFHAAMCADFSSVETALLSLADEQDANIQFMAESLRGILERYREVPEPRGLREWHYVLNDSLLLHLSPSGFDDPMHGRYAWVQDSDALIHEGLILLRECGVQPQTVASSTDRSSRVLALAAARFFGAELLANPDKADLLITYDLDLVGDADFFAAASQRRPICYLWSHAACWTKPFPFAADFVTFLYQHNRAPWDEGQMTFDLDSKEAKLSEASEASDEELAKAILDARPEPLETQGGTEPLVSLAQIALPSMSQRLQPRPRQRTGGPIPSARFL